MELANLRERLEFLVDMYSHVDDETCASYCHGAVYALKTVIKIIDDEAWERQQSGK